MDTQKMNELKSLIETMDIKDVMMVVNADLRVMILQWFYPEHIAKLWDVKREVVDSQMFEIKEMFTDVICNGGINPAYDVEEQKEYASGWNIDLAD